MHNQLFQKDYVLLDRFILFRYSLSSNCFYSSRKNRRIGSIETSSAYRCASISLRTWRQTTFFHRRACIFHSEASREYGRRTTKLKSGIHRFRRTSCEGLKALTESSLYPFLNSLFLEEAQHSYFTFPRIVYFIF